MLLLTLLAAFLSSAPFQPATEPDLVLVTFSGRSGSLGLGPCTPGACPPRDNVSYLASPEGTGTARALETALEAAGLSVESFHASSFVEAHYSYLSEQEELGYVDAEAFLVESHRRYVAGRSDPARILLLGHSHGAVWASLLAWSHPEIPITYLVSLDGVCTGWAGDRAGYLRQYFEDVGGYPQPLGTALEPCAAEGQRYAVSDLVPPNVRYGLEVQSAPILTKLGTELGFAHLRKLETLPDLETLERALERAYAWSQEGRDLSNRLRELELPDPTELGDLSLERLGRGLTEGLEEAVEALRRELNLFRDGTVNVRPDGSSEGLFVYRTAREDHTEVTRPGSEALCWLRGALLALEQNKDVTNVGCATEVDKGTGLSSQVDCAGFTQVCLKLLHVKEKPIVSQQSTLFIMWSRSFCHI